VNQHRDWKIKRLISPFPIDKRVGGTAGMKFAECMAEMLPGFSPSEPLMVGCHPGSDLLAARLLFPAAHICGVSTLPAFDKVFCFKFIERDNSTLTAMEFCDYQFVRPHDFVWIDAAIGWETGSTDIESRKDPTAQMRLVSPMLTKISKTFSVPVVFKATGYSLAVAGWLYELYSRCPGCFNMFKPRRSYCWNTEFYVLCKPTLDPRVPKRQRMSVGQFRQKLCAWLEQSAITRVHWNSLREFALLHPVIRNPLQYSDMWTEFPGLSLEAYTVANPDNVIPLWACRQLAAMRSLESLVLFDQDGILSSLLSFPHSILLLRGHPVGGAGENPLARIVHTSLNVPCFAVLHRNLAEAYLSDAINILREQHTIRILCHYADVPAISNTLVGITSLAIGGSWYILSRGH